MTSLIELGRSARNAVLDRVGRGVSKVQERTPLKYDLLESDDAYLVVFDAPGASRSDVQVRFVENEVQVRIDRFRDFREGFEMRFPGRGLSLDGSATLPDGTSVDPTESTATLAATGELRVRVPKADADRGTTVEVEGPDVEVGGASGTDSDDASGADAADDVAGETLDEPAADADGPETDDARIDSDDADATRAGSDDANLSGTDSDDEPV